MKKLQIVLAVVLSIASASNAKAQLLSASVPATEKAFEASAAPAEAYKYSSASVMFTKGGVKAVRHFKTKFKDGPNVKWFAEKNVISASFDENSIKNTVVYRKNGTWLRNMKVYHEAELSADIKQLIKRSIYGNHSITLVQEFLEDDLQFYVVHLEDAKTIKQITVYDGEINLYSKIRKQ